MSRRGGIAAYLALALYIALVIYLCFGHFDGSPQLRSLFGIPADKIVHFAMFFPFPILTFLAFGNFTRKWLSVTIIFLIGCLIAALTELGQSLLTDYRTGDRLDFAADALALALSSLIVLIFDYNNIRTTTCPSRK